MSEKHLPGIGGAFDRIVFDGDGTAWVPERTCKFKLFKNQRSKLISEGVCSECSSYMHSEMLYCPNCGAKVVDE